MDNLKEIKEQIKKDWLEAFPDLKATTPLRYYKIVGPCVIGLELIKSWSSNTYRPHLSINSLYHESNKKSIDGWIQIIQLLDKKGFQFDIEYRWHEKYVERACERVKDQFGLFFRNGDIKLDEFISFIDVELEEKLNVTNLYDEVILYKLKYLLFFKYQPEHCYEITEQILEKKENWIKRNFKDDFGELDKWVESLKNINIEQLNNKIEENINHKKLKKLNRFEII